MKLLSSLVIAILMCSCATQQRCACKWPTKDSVSVRVERHDSVSIVHDSVMVPYQELTFLDESPCPPQTSYTKTVVNKGLKSTVTIKDGKIISKCEADSLKAVVEKKDYYITILKTELNQKVTEKIVYLLHWWDHLFRWGFFIMLGIWIVIFIDRFILNK